MNFFRMIIVAGFLSGILMIASCEFLTNTKEIDPEKTIAKQGNSWEASATNYPGSTITVTSNDKGTAVFTLNYDGQDYVLKGKVSETKIEDFVYSGGDESKPFTLVDFDANVGDKWEYAIGTQKVVREVTHKSTDDDTFAPGLYLMIKVSEVTETIPEGISVNGYPAECKKIVWTFNHKFGFIAAEVTKNDNSVEDVWMTNTNAGK